QHAGEASNSLRLLHEKTHCLPHVPRSLRARELHRIDGFSHAGGDRERNPPDVSEWRIKRAPLEILGSDQIRQSAGGGEEDLLWDAPSAAGDDAKSDTGEH